MYYINKVVTWVFCPIGFVYVCLALGVMLRWLARRNNRFVRCRKIGLWVAVSSLVLLWLLGCGVTIRFIGAPLEREFLKDGCSCGEIGELEEVDVIVLLGGGMGAHAKCQAFEAFQGCDRVIQAARLWKEYERIGIRQKIICTGGGVEFSTIPFLVEMGVPREVVEFSEEPRNTAEEAALLKRGNVGKIALVTSAWHMKRAKMLFQRNGIAVCPVPGDFEMTYVSEAPLEFKDFLPSSDGLLRNSVAIKEWIALLGYGIVR